MAESNKKPRAERTKNNRELILEKSVELFRDKGYEQTTMADISRATGLTNGSIYPPHGRLSKKPLALSTA